MTSSNPNERKDKLVRRLKSRITDGDGEEEGCVDKILWMDFFDTTVPVGMEEVGRLCNQITRNKCMKCVKYMTEIIWSPMNSCSY